MYSQEENTHAAQAELDIERSHSPRGYGTSGEQLAVDVEIFQLIHESQNQSQRPDVPDTDQRVDPVELGLQRVDSGEQQREAQLEQRRRDQAGCWGVHLSEVRPHAAGKCGDAVCLLRRPTRGPISLVHPECPPF